MVLEQGALTGKYDTQHPLPEGSARVMSYNKVLPQLEKLTSAMNEIGERQGASIAQVAIAWAIAKNTLPIIGVTKTSQVEEAVHASEIGLTEDEMEKLETLAVETGVDTKGAWEKSMVQ